MENEKESAGSSAEQKQRDVICAMARGEPLDEILVSHQVSEKEFVDWVCAGKFPAYAASLARGFAETKAAYVWGKLIEMARNGNSQAMRLYLDVLYRKPGSRTENPADGNPEQELTALRDSIFIGRTGGE